VHAEVVIHFMGTPAGVEEGGVLSPSKTHVVVETLATSIPSGIELDISGVAIGEALRIADLPDLEGVLYTEDPETVLMSVTAPAAEIEEEPEEVEGEEVEGAEELAEGEEPDGQAEESAADESGGE
jgi:large subunit ribosomal protein L25